MAYGLGEEQNGAKELIGTLKARTRGGGHQAAVAVDAVPIQNTVFGRADTAGPGGPGYGVEGDPMFTLGVSGGPQTVAYVKVIRSGARDAEGNLPPEVWAEQDVAPTLNVMDNTGDTRATVIVPTSTVRRLTPKECERLQGFPDDWTAERYDWKKGEVVPQADSARYKQMGNAVAVPVFEWVMRRLVEVASRDTQAR